MSVAKKEAMISESSGELKIDKRSIKWVGEGI